MVPFVNFMSEQQQQAWITSLNVDAQKWRGVEGRAKKPVHVHVPKSIKGAAENDERSAAAAAAAAATSGKFVEMKLGIMRLASALRRLIYRTETRMSSPRGGNI